MRIGLCLVVAFVCACECRFNFSNTQNYNNINETCSSRYFTKFNETLTIAQPVYTIPAKMNISDIFHMWHSFPVQVLETSRAVSSRCATGYKKYLAKLIEGDLKALKMFDATAKLPSGLLRGNVNQYGDFDECLEVEEAQYCLIELDLSALWKKSNLSEYRHLVHSHFSIKETFDDPGHRVPGFNIVRWGFCIPKGCNGRDLSDSLRKTLGVKARARPFLCQMSIKKPLILSLGDYVARIYFSIIVICIIISTLYYEKLGKKYDSKIVQMIMSFSFKKNYSQLIRISESIQNEYKSVHGARFLAALALLMAHKTMALLYNPYINRTWMTETHSMEWSVIGRNAIIFTDVFLLISGLLNASVLFKELDKGNYFMHFKEKIFNRLFRILPSLISVILFCTYLLPYLGSGPLWPLVVDHHSILCKKYMWRNMFLIHNYFGFENMCLTHTHQVGIDMQLFLATPLFVYLIWRYKRTGFWIIATFAALSTALRFWATMKYNLSHFVHFGIPISRMFDTANYSYILPTHRATIYLMGVTLAYALRYTRKRPSITKGQTAIIWTLLYLVSFGTWFGPINMSVRTYEYNKLQAALYGAISPITWGAGVAWVIYSTERGFGSWFAYILNWKYFEVFTRIAYAVYLVQFPVFFYNVGIRRHVDEYKSYMMLPPLETGVILGLSTLLTLCIDMPFQNIGKICLLKKRRHIN
ncbi:nose resistant to fluoxetine protein 6-like isoform X2 [Cylas formicarius]|uniref:nose resistant to fluoxetine protein 6-like isoform X2 n=1 Tax=Cylas formicarius TaxID=197179 RepID=UPI0029584CC8|nr:nose resistant to fluoxetine protein 6-like isoform X2 [Cylas formicarius]